MKYLIRSTQYRAWLRPGARRYTNNLALAGVYDEATAKAYESEGSCLAVPLASMLPELRLQRARLAQALAETDMLISLAMEPGKAPEPAAEPKADWNPFGIPPAPAQGERINVCGWGLWEMPDASGCVSAQLLECSLTDEICDAIGEVVERRQPVQTPYGPGAFRRMDIVNGGGASVTVQLDSWK